MCLAGLLQSLKSASSLEAVATREADDEEDDKDEDQHNNDNDDLHLEVLPPHLAAKLLAGLVEFVSLQRACRAHQSPLQSAI